MPGRVMANVLVVAAFELGDPMIVLVLVKADDGLLHSWITHRERDWTAK